MSNHTAVNAENNLSNVCVIISENKKEMFVFLMAWFYFTSKRKGQLPCFLEVIHISVKKLIDKDIFASVEVIKALKENGENVYKMLNTRLRNCKIILAFMKKEIKDNSVEKVLLEILQNSRPATF